MSIAGDIDPVRWKLHSHKHAYSTNLRVVHVWHHALLLCMTILIPLVDAECNTLAWYINTCN